MRRFITILLLLIASLPFRSFAETTLGTAITSIPITITKAGVYHLTKDLGFSLGHGAAITVDASDVVIDFNAHAIVDETGTTTTSIGVNCGDENRVTLKDGTIRGFHDGVVLNSDGASLTDLLVTDCYSVGISVTGNNIQLLNNRVSGTGGVSATSSLYAVGISLSGTYGNICNNDVQNISVTDTTDRYAEGIRLKNCSEMVLSNNRVLDVEPAAPTIAASTGISIVTSANLIILANTVVTAQTGFDLSGGASGKYGDNITSGDTTDYNTSGSGMVSFDTNN